MEYNNEIMEMRGIIVEIHDGGVAVDIKGRIGQIRIPMRMLVTNYPLKLGQEVGFRMSLLEVLFEKPNEKYLENIVKNNKK